jgi:ligand-binding SRPBCC domain-containing protein
MDGLPGRRVKVRRFSCSASLALAREQVFPFFAAAANLEQITPPELQFRIVPPLPVEMREGTLIKYRLRLHGIPFEWLTRISVWNPPHEFVDEQLRGPYRQWIHRHTFVADGDRTRMDDVVDYALPLYPLGEFAAPIVAAQIRRIFAYRTSAIDRLLLRRV